MHKIKIVHVRKKAERKIRKIEEKNFSLFLLSRYSKRFLTRFFAFAAAATKQIGSYRIISSFPIHKHAAAVNFELTL